MTCVKLVLRLVTLCLWIGAAQTSNAYLIHDYVRDGNIKGISECLKNGVFVGFPDSRGNTPLHIAALYSTKEVVEFLLDNGAFIEARNLLKLSPLHCAVGVEKVEIIKVLVQRKAKMEAKGVEGKTPLLQAAFFGYEEGCRFLIEQGARVDACDDHKRTLLHYAAMGGNEKIIALAWSKMKSGIDVRDDCLRTPLHLAGLCGKLESIEFLLTQGANIEAWDSEGCTPLYLAVQGNRIEAVHMLLKKGAFVDVKNNGLWTPLHCAASSNFVDVVKLLIKQGAKVNTKSIFGVAPLDSTVKSVKRVEVATLLIESGAEVSRRALKCFTHSSAFFRRFFQMKPFPKKFSLERIRKPDADLKLMLAFQDECFNFFARFKEAVRKNKVDAFLNDEETLTKSDTYRLCKKFVKSLGVVPKGLELTLSEEMLCAKFFGTTPLKLFFTRHPGLLQMTVLLFSSLRPRIGEINLDEMKSFCKK
ncbi:TPA: hypothetical protein DDZ86_01565 [Candidatus Dependentiae bacterium]|nr:MAG: hypothetical protein UW09_C0001G0323 [candidate division TM6 bacterium GW2011_GWF2_43_87]HBL98312.1 hypothetical protein [Candidatus Dependentiae bacterium]